IVVVALNQEMEAKNFELTLGESSQMLSIDAQAIQTIVIK
ncbi:MAG: hypothetical protein KJO16_05720, partial [Muriicola sp.]|nr:hypothetical protein [Muriicola sp.]